MLGYIRMEGEIKALFLHQAAFAEVAFFLFLVAKIAVLLFACIGLIFWDLEIPSRGEKSNLHAHTHRHTCLLCSSLSVCLQRYFVFIVYKSLVVYSKFLLIYNPRYISQKNPLSYCSTLFPFLKHVAEQLSYQICAREASYFIVFSFHSVLPS